MLVGPAAELAAVVGEHRLYPCLVRLEGRNDVPIHQLDGGDGQLGRVEPRPSVAAVQSLAVCK